MNRQIFHRGAWRDVPEDLAHTFAHAEAVLCLMIGWDTGWTGMLFDVSQEGGERVPVRLFESEAHIVDVRRQRDA